VSKQKTTRAKTSRSLPVFIADTSSTTGGGLSGVTHASSGLVLEYRRQNQSTWTSVTPVSKTLGTYVSGGIVSNGSLAGRYEVDFPDAAFASAAGVEWVEMCIRGVTNMLPVLIEIELDAVDYQDAAAFGLSRLNDTITSRMASYTQPTGFLTATFPGAVASPTNITQASGVTLAPTTGLGNQTADITGNLSGSVGSVTGAVGSVASYGTLVNDVATAVWSAGARTLTGFGTLVSDVATAVWGAASRTLTAFGFYVSLTPATGMGNQSGTVGGISGVTFPANFGSMVINGTTGHTAAVVHSVQAGAYTSAAFSANWLTAAGLASDAANEIATAVSGIQVLSRLDSMIEDDGTGQFRFDTIALSMAPAGGGGGGNQTINVYPVSAATPERVAGTTITYHRNEIRSVSVVTDFTLTNLTLSLTIEDSEGTDLLTIPNGSISRSGQTFTVSIGTAVTSSVGNKRWALRDLTGGTNSVIARGVFSVQEAASA